MIAGPVLLAVLALVAGGVEIEAEIQAEGRARSLGGDGVSSSRELELRAAPRLALAATWPEGRLGASWAARLVGPALGDGGGIDPWQELLLEGRRRAAPGLELHATGGGALGTSSPLTEAGTGGTTDPVPTGGRLRHFEVRCGAGLDARPTPATTLAATLGWTRSGGADRASRAVLPLVSDLHLDAAVTWRAGRLDELSATLTAEDARFDDGPRAALALLSGRWRRLLEPGLSAWLGGGGGLVLTEGLVVPDRHREALQGEAGLELTLPRLSLTQQLLARASPAVDRLAGTVDTRFEGEYLGRLGELPGWRLTGRAVVALTERAEGTDRLALAELRLERALARSLSAWAGGYVNRQQTTDPARPSLVEWGALLGLTWRLPGRGGAPEAPPPER
ncbi:MAG: hypothetical protein NDI82_08160 [Anaeromyxobacteraceae bacterium]|nr:hypothetical protein [Anaeromyxobacteraceae bacterium]